MALLNYKFKIMRKQAFFGRVEEIAFFDDPDTYLALTHACEGVRVLMGTARFVPAPDGPLPDGWVRAGRASYLRMQDRIKDALPHQRMDEHPDDPFQFEVFLARLKSDTPLRGEVGMTEGRGFKTNRLAWTAAAFGALVAFFGGIYYVADNRETITDPTVQAAATIADESGLADAVDTSRLAGQVQDTAMGIIGDVNRSEGQAERKMRDSVKVMRDSLDALHSRR